MKWAGYVTRVGTIEIRRVMVGNLNYRDPLPRSRLQEMELRNITGWCVLDADHWWALKEPTVKLWGLQGIC
jgi:hypothetical protein